MNNAAAFANFADSFRPAVYAREQLVPFLAVDVVTDGDIADSVSARALLAKPTATCRVVVVHANGHQWSRMVCIGESFETILRDAVDVTLGSTRAATLTDGLGFLGFDRIA